MRQLKVLGLLAGLALSSPALAAEGTLNVTRGSGTTIAATAADGAGNISVIQTLCGGVSAVMGTACTSQAIFDSQGLHVYVANVNPNGQATMANSSPVVLSSDQFGTAAVANYGTAPTGTVFGVNAFVTNPISATITWPGTASVSNYGTAPTGTVPGVNAAVTWPGTATLTNYGTAPTGTVPGANVNCTNCTSSSVSPPPPNDVAAGPQNFTGAATLAVNSQGSGSVGLVVSGTYTGAAWTLQASVDGTNYVTIPFWDNTAGGTIYTAQPSATVGGTYVAFAAGYRSVRINVTAVSTGTLVASLNSSAGSAQHPISTQGVNSNINGFNGAAVTQDPCTWQAKTSLAISGNGTSLAQIVAASGSKKIYVCSISLLAAGATAYNLNTGTGSNCGSSTAALLGSTTAANGLTFVAGGGMTLGNGGASVLVTAASSEICTLQSNAVYVSGSMTYVQQ